jgi:hypothetical protein
MKPSTATLAAIVTPMTQNGSLAMIHTRTTMRKTMFVQNTHDFSVFSAGAVAPRRRQLYQTMFATSDTATA